MDAERLLEADPSSELERTKAFLLSDPEVIRSDSAFLAELGLRLDAANIVDFGPVALSRVAAAHQRESSERKRLEAISQANFDAQARTHSSVLDLIGSADHADLADRIDEMARFRFGLVSGVVAVEGAGSVPCGWRALVEGQVDLILGQGAAWRMGHAPTALGLFEDQAHSIGSLAMVRLTLWSEQRSGVLAFGAADPETFTDDMGPDLIAFLARVTERTAERWPSP
jgi:hypothetical protein